MAEHFDALVVGGGPAGATAALLLARAGWSVAVIERQAFPRRKVCGEYLSATNARLIRHLGLATWFDQVAGPGVRHVGIFAGATESFAPLPRLGTGGWGRALGRESLDTALLQQAHAAGASVYQPAAVTDTFREGQDWCLRVQGGPPERPFWLRSPIIIAASGSWDPGPLPWQPRRTRADAADLLAFKAHFQQSHLPPGFMPLLSFPGGYGGMVHCDRGRISVSCCLRRDALAQVRRLHSGTAGEAVEAHLQTHCLGVRRVLAGARREGAWLAAGPIRPGVRLRHAPGIFPVGNCAGEAHPVIAEGISMALQSAWLVTRHLTRWQQEGRRSKALLGVQSEYANDWRRAFLPRLQISRVLAQWAMHPELVARMHPLLHQFPALLTWGARWTGKVSRVISS